VVIRLQSDADFLSRHGCLFPLRTRNSHSRFSTELLTATRLTSLFFCQRVQAQPGPPHSPPTLKRGLEVTCVLSPRPRQVAIAPSMHCLAVSAALEQRVLNLVNSATPRHFLQPGRVGNFEEFSPSRTGPVPGPSQPARQCQIQPPDPMPEGLTRQRVCGSVRQPNR